MKDKELFEELTKIFVRSHYALFRMNANEKVLAGIDLYWLDLHLQQIIDEVKKKLDDKECQDYIDESFKKRL